MGAMDQLLSQTLTAAVQKLGITPESLKAEAIAARDLILGFDAQLKTIAENQRAILAALERLEQNHVTQTGSKGKTNGSGRNAFIDNG